MGRVRVSRRRTSKTKDYKKSHKTDNRARDIDQIQDDLIREQKTGVKMTFEFDDDLPGGGQFYCVSLLYICFVFFARIVPLNAH